MSSTVTIRPTRGVRGIGLFSIIAGIVLIVAGVVVWVVVSQTLSDEQITVSDDASMFAGQHVAGPLTAYAQAEVINEHALAETDGQTYAQLAQDDPARDVVMNASFLRASLFTSVVAFGVCALVIGLGVLFVLVGGAIRGLAGGPQVAVESPGLSSHGDLSGAPRHADPATTPVAPAPPPARPTTRAPNGPPAAPPTAPPNGPTTGSASPSTPAPPPPEPGPGGPPSTGETPRA